VSFEDEDKQDVLESFCSLDLKVLILKKDQEQIQAKLLTVSFVNRNKLVYKFS